MAPPPFIHTPSATCTAETMYKEKIKFYGSALYVELSFDAALGVAVFWYFPASIFDPKAPQSVSRPLRLYRGGGCPVGGLYITCIGGPTDGADKYQ